MRDVLSCPHLQMENNKAFDVYPLNGGHEVRRRVSPASEMLLTSPAEETSVVLSKVMDPRSVALPKKTERSVGAPKEEKVKSRRQRRGLAGTR